MSPEAIARLALYLPGAAISIISTFMTRGISFSCSCFTGCSSIFLISVALEAKTCSVAAFERLQACHFCVGLHGGGRGGRPVVPCFLQSHTHTQDNGQDVQLSMFILFLLSFYSPLPNHHLLICSNMLPIMHVAASRRVCEDIYCLPAEKDEHS